MRKAKQIIYEHYGCKSWEEVCKDFLTEVSPSMIEEIVIKAQLDMATETAKRCAKAAQIKIVNAGYVDEFIDVNRSSILRTAKKIRKEINNEKS